MSAAERANELSSVSEWANRRASGPVLTPGFLAVLDHCAMTNMMTKKPSKLKMDQRFLPWHHPVYQGAGKKSPGEDNRTGRQWHLRSDKQMDKAIVRNSTLNLERHLRCDRSFFFILTFWRGFAFGRGASLWRYVITEGRSFHLLVILEIQVNTELSWWLHYGPE